MATADPVPVVGPATAAAAPKKGKKQAYAPKKPRSSPSHPTYVEMIGEAIASLKERTGSSQYAITKFVEDKHRAHLPPTFKKLILVQLRRLTAGGKLTKIKNSYKLSSAAAPKKPAAAAAAAKPKSAAAAKVKLKKSAAAAGKKRPAPAAKPGARAAKSAKTSAKDAPAKKAAKPKAAVFGKAKKAVPSPAKVKKAVRPKSVKKTPVKKSSAPARKAKK